MAKLIFIVLALCLVQVSLARVARDAPAGPVAEENSWLNTLKAFQAQAATAFENVHQSVLKSLGFQSDEQVVETIKENTGKYVEQLKTVQATIQEEIKKNSNVFEPIVQSLNQRITETTQKLSEQNPELTSKAKEYQESVQTNIQSLLSEVQKTGEQLKESSRGATEQLQTALKQLYETTVDTLQKTATELKPAKPE